MAKFFVVQVEQVEKLRNLVDRKIDGEYVVLQQSNGFTDIAQFSSKYQAVRIVTVPSGRLDWTLRLA